MKLQSGTEKMRNAGGHQDENEGSEKERTRTHMTFPP